MFCVCVVLKAVERINGAIRAGVPEKTVEELMNPDAQLPEVYPSAADLYQRELASLQQQSPEVPSKKRTHPKYKKHRSSSTKPEPENENSSPRHQSVPR